MLQDVDRNARRAARQQLESLSRAGLTHLPRWRTPPASGAQLPAPLPETDAACAEAPAAMASSRAENAAPPAASSAIALFPELEPKSSARIASGLASVPTQPRSTLSRAEREAKLAVLAQRVAACTRCQALAQTRTQTVFGVGNPEATIMFIGEAPGADEDRQGEPFVGRAGQLLNKIIEACHLKREDIYICNILRCRPPENRNPLPEEAANCREYLDGQINLVDPDYIVCWGSVAAQNLLETTNPIGRLRGKFSQYGRSKVLCTYHPSYLLRNPAAKKDVWEDMKFLFHDMGIDLTVN
jgi:DNA polymerase